ncbi:helix-turn-helix domain-containing protein [Spirochaetota bacterium]
MNDSNIEYNYFNFFRLFWIDDLDKYHDVHSHKHEGIEILITSGDIQGSIITPAEKIKFTEDSSIVIPSNIPHSMFYVAKDIKTDLLIIVINKKKLFKLFRTFYNEKKISNKLAWFTNGQKCIVFNRSAIDEEVKEFEKFRDGIYIQLPDDLIISNRIIFSVISIIFKIYNNLQSEPLNRSFPKNIIDDRMQRIISILQKNYTEKIDLDQLSLTEGITKVYLCKLFKNETGQTILDYLNNIRITKAIALINKGKRKITEICYECGYNDISFFIQKFKKTTGTTPHKYINNHR